MYWTRVMVILSGCQYPSLWDDKAGCICAPRSRRRLTLDLDFPYFIPEAFKIIVRFDGVARAAND